MYKKILGQSLKQSVLATGRRDLNRLDSSVTNASASPHIVPPREDGDEGANSNGAALISVPGLTEQQNRKLAHQVVEVAATAATIASRDPLSTPTKTISNVHHTPSHQRTPGMMGEDNDDGATMEALAPAGGHDAPNWGRVKSTVVLLGATVLYAIIAEILVNTVDVVLDNADINEKFVGITLFALVPNTTEFLVRTNPPISSNLMYMIYHYWRSTN